MRMNGHTFADFGEKGRGSGTKEYRWLLEVGKGKKTDFVLQPSEGNSTLSTS